MILAAPVIRVLLVDDHAIVREGIAAVLALHADIEVVGDAGDGASALALFRTLRPDVCVVDVRMSPMDGIEVTQAMRAINATVRVVMLTSYDTDDEVFRALRAGASSFLLKSVDSATLVSTIRTVHAGRKSISPEIAGKLAEHVSSESLTVRQQQVLDWLARGSSNGEIADALSISDGTVKAHIKVMLQKLGARDRTQALTIAIRRGLVRIRKDAFGRDVAKLPTS
jgi:two-component system NarL family response regulator